MYTPGVLSFTFNSLWRAGQNKKRPVPEPGCRSIWSSASFIRVGWHFSYSDVTDVGRRIVVVRYGIRFQQFLLLLTNLSYLLSFSNQEVYALLFECALRREQNILPFNQNHDIHVWFNSFQTPKTLESGWTQSAVLDRLIPMRSVILVP